jgi:hypothetical protein
MWSTLLNAVACIVVCVLMLLMIAYVCTMIVAGKYYDIAVKGFYGPNGRNRRTECGAPRSL